MQGCQQPIEWLVWCQVLTTSLKSMERLFVEKVYPYFLKRKQK